MEQLEHRYQLQLEGHLIREGQLPGFNQVTHHPTLRAALTGLNDIRNDWFDETKVRQQGLPQLCTDARVIDLSNNTVVAAKYLIGPDDLLGFAPGVYLRLNTGNVSRAEYEKQTGTVLPDMPSEMQERGYYLMTPSQSMEVKVGIVKKLTGAFRRKLKPGKPDGNRL